MATHKSCEKRARQTVKKTIRNRALKGTVKTAIKDVKLAVLPTANPEQLPQILKKAIVQISKAKSKGIYSKAKASRMISRITLFVNKAKAK